MLIVDQEKLRFNRVKREMDPSSWQKHHFEWDFLCSLRFNGFQVCWWCFGEICEVSPYLHVPGSLVLLVKDGRTKSCLDPAPILLLSIQQLDASRRPRVLCPAMEVSFVWTWLDKQSWGEFQYPRPGGLELFPCIPYLFIYLHAHAYCIDIWHINNY